MFNDLHVNKKIEFLEKESYFIFYINDFLNDDQFKLIQKNFIDISKNDLRVSKYDLGYHNLKLSVNNYDTPSLFEKVVKNNFVMMNFYNYLSSKSFNNFVLNNFYKYILQSRKSDLSVFFKILFRKNRITTNRNKKFYEKFLFNNILSQIELSYMYNNSKIVPHTDARSKLISLMLYFPDDYLSDEQILKLGTTFYKCDIKNLTNKHLRDEEEEKKFKKNNKIILTLPFKKKNLYGFIRTDKSWHTVEPVNIKEDFIRKSINVNLLIN